jgi:hypothetical protein
MSFKESLSIKVPSSVMSILKNALTYFTFSMFCIVDNFIIPTYRGGN